MGLREQRRLPPSHRSAAGPACPCSTTCERWTPACPRWISRWRSPARRDHAVSAGAGLGGERPALVRTWPQLLAYFRPRLVLIGERARPRNPHGSPRRIPSLGTVIRELAEGLLRGRHPACESGCREPRTSENASSSLLPTPGANDHTGAEGPTRAAEREAGTGGPGAAGPRVPAADAHGEDGANTGGPSQYELNSLPLNALVKLLPTPTRGTARARAAATCRARRRMRA